jgi:signal transduction protein with GAF and PtsI domain
MTFRRNCAKKATAEGLNSFCDLPLISRDRSLGILAVARRNENAFGSDEVTCLAVKAPSVWERRFVQ